MQSEIISLAKKLIIVRSETRENLSLNEVLNVAKMEFGGFHVEEFEREGIPSLLVSNKNESVKQFKVILNAHLDVVPGREDQYVPIVKGGKLFGRGAYDMKAAAAVMIMVFKELAGKVDYPLGLQITTDEEVGGEHGTGYQLENGVRADFAITGEGTNFNVVNEAKSRVLIHLATNGKASHSAYPWLGENAIWKMVGVLSKLHEAYPIPESEYHGTTLNITNIVSDNQTHKTPDFCEAFISARVIVSEKSAFRENIRKLAADQATVEFKEVNRVHVTDSNNIYIQNLRETANKIMEHEVSLSRAHGGSDAVHFSSLDIPVVEFGPIGGEHHADEEWVDVESLVKYYEVLKRFLLSISA